MVQDNVLTQPVPLLPSWEKIKAGVVGFTKTVVGYLPRAIVMMGLVMGASALLGAVTPGNAGDLLGVMKAYGDGALLSRIGIGLLIGGLFSGSIGAYESIHAAQRNHAANHAATMGKARTQEIPQPQQEVSLDIAPPRLPVAAAEKPVNKPMMR